jgi:hypothetical protein
VIPSHRGNTRIPEFSYVPRPAFLGALHSGVPPKAIDGDFALLKLHWSSWGQSSAHGAGTISWAHGRHRLGRSAAPVGASRPCRGRDPAAPARRGIELCNLYEMQLQPEPADPGLLIGYGNIRDAAIDGAVAALADVIRAHG